MKQHTILLALAAGFSVTCGDDDQRTNGFESNFTGAASAGPALASSSGDSGSAHSNTSDGVTSPVTDALLTSGAGPSTRGATSDPDPNDTESVTGDHAPDLPDTTDEGDTGESGGSSDTSGGPGGTGGNLPPPGGGATDANLLVALVGDQGSGSDTKAVYQLVLDEGADFLLILGDFDYGNSPSSWAAEMKSVLGDSYPVFGVVGNHDKDAWSGYQEVLSERLAKIPGATCTGELGVKASCHYRGLHFILSGLGTLGSDSSHEQFLADTLEADESVWSLCLWHKTMRDLQAGNKSNEITWKALQICQDKGAIVAMGHEHSYARTRTLTKLGSADEGHGAIGAPEALEVGPGRTFTVTSGLGGKSIRGYDSSLHKDDTWWATLYTSNYYRRNGDEIKPFDADHGVLFLRFHVGGDPAQAHGYFKNIQGEVIDEFDVTRK